MMGNYSLGGGLDPELMRAIMTLPPSPYGQLLQQNPGAGADVSSMLGRITEGQGVLLRAEDSAFGRASPVATNTGPDGPSPVDVLTGILTSPFRLLRGGVQAIEDATGHPNAIRRGQREAEADVLTQIAMSTFPPERLAAAGIISPEQAQAARAPYVAAQSGGGEIATGRDTTGMPNPTPTSGWFWDWFTGAQAKEKQRQLDKLMAFYQSMGMTYELEKLKEQVASERTEQYRDTAAGNYSMAGVRLRDAQTAEVAPTALAQRTRDYAAAGASGAQAGYYGARTREVGAEGARKQQYFEGVEMPRGLQENRQADTAFGQDRGIKIEEHGATMSKLLAETEKLEAERRKAEGMSATNPAETYRAETERMKAIADAQRGSTQKPPLGPQALGDTFGLDVKPPSTAARMADWLLGPLYDAEPEVDLRSRGHVPATQPQLIPGQARRGFGSRTQEILRKYPKPEDVDRAYMAEEITEAEAWDALEALGVQRPR